MLLFAVSIILKYKWNIPKTTQKTIIFLYFCIDKSHERTKTRVVLVCHLVLSD